MRRLRLASVPLILAFLFPAAAFAAGVPFPVPPARRLDTPSAKDVTVCIATEAVRDMRQFEARPGSPDIPSLQSARIPQNRCVGRNRNLYGKALDNILIDGNQTVEGLVADSLAAALAGMGFTVVRDKDRAPADAWQVEILVDRLWGWMDVPQGRIFLDETDSQMVGGMETRINVTPPGGRPATLTATGEGRCNLGVRWGAAWQKMMTLMLQSYMNRAQSRFAELDFAAPDETAEAVAPPPVDAKEQLRKIEELRDEQLITEEEYRQKRQEILDRL